MLIPYEQFDQYTIIIGYHLVGAPNYCVIEQNIIIESKKIELNLIVQDQGGSFGVICSLYYWGIYPKIKNKSISVNILNFIEK